MTGLISGYQYPQRRWEGLPALGPLESALSMATGALASVPAGISGMAMLPRGPQAAEDAIGRVMGRLTYQPRSLQGQAANYALGRAGEVAEKPFDWLGRTATDLTGSPFVGAMAYAVPQMLIGLGAGRRAAMGPQVGASVPSRFGQSGAVSGSGLPMDIASRMQRAKEQGFKIEGYHGTGSSFPEFDRIAWISKSPELANEYAYMRGQLGGDPNVIPLMGRTENIFDADKLPKTVTAGKFFDEALAQAKAQGRDIDMERAKSLLARVKEGAKTEESGPHYQRHDFWYRPADYFGKEGGEAITKLMDDLGFGGIKMMEKGSETIGIRDPSFIRSKHAAFDPAKRHSSDILAGMAGLGFGLGALGQEYANRPR